MSQLSIATTNNQTSLLKGRVNLVVTSILILGLLLLVQLWPSDTPLDLLNKYLAPNTTHWFGTDWLGRDMLTRSLNALNVSLKVGFSAVACSGILAIGFATLAMLHSRLRSGINILIDVMLSLPHLILLLLLSLCFGGSEYGLFMAITLSHWPKTCRLLMGEMLTIRQMPYFQVALQFGTPKHQVIWRHMVPHLLPQWLTAILLLFPHALTHMASLTFLGFGLNPLSPSIGGLLSEASRYLLTGHWWLAVCPGLLLIGCIVLLSSLAQQCNNLVRER